MEQGNLHRVFLGLDQPPLVSAAEWLIETYRTESSLGPMVDLSNALVVLPTARSQHRLLQLLVACSDVKSLRLQPPRMMTIGSLPEQLYVAAKPLASELTQHIAWVNAIEQTPADELQPLLGERDPDVVIDFQSLATAISDLHIRLANDIWSFNSVHREVSKDSSFLAGEARRWEVLTGIQQRYYKLLADENLWDRYGARNFSAAGLLKANEIRCQTDREIVLVGCADVNRSTSEMLRQISVSANRPTDNRPQISALVAADESIADRFDEFGSVVTEAWLDATIAIEDSQILIADRPTDQAFAAAHFLAALPEESALAADQITIGLPDETHAPLVERTLRTIGLESRRLAGTPISRTAPARLLLAVRDFLIDESYDSFASLIRHPDLFDWLTASVNADDWLHHFDEFQNAQLPSRIDLSEPHPFGDPAILATEIDPKDPKSQSRAQRNARTADRLNEIALRLAQLLQPLTGPPQPIAEWTTAWSELLIQVYGNQKIEVPTDSNAGVTPVALAACETLLDILSDQTDVPDSFTLETTAGQALGWALDAAAGRRVIPDSNPTALELAGWLDLPLDDAEVLIVTSFNEGKVPTSEIGHQFLPNALCEQLQVRDNNRRYARDAYVLSVIASVRKRFLLITGRRDEQGEPLRPSRLLFADTPTVAARRARAFFHHDSDGRSADWLTTATIPPKEQQFTVPAPSPIDTIDNLTVTSFREYIKCPYRFYLNKVLRLDTITDDWRELDGGAFGDLCHNVLEAFANDPIKEISAFLSAELDRQSDAKHGGKLPAVRIQIEQLRERLRAFAPLQAAHRAAGWRIVSTEELLEHEMEVDGQPFTIRGKIDRVDQHQTTGQVAVWDYKTTSKGPTPDSKHYAPKKGKWKDLQLPLYRHLVKEVNAIGDANLDDMIAGFVLLHEKADEIKFCKAEKLPGLQESAQLEFESIVRNLRSAKFWPPVYPPPEYADDYAAICQDNVFERFSIDSVSVTDAATTEVSS
jgi:hypothetical protein